MFEYEPRIVAGDDASDGAWPWIGSLRFTVPPNKQEHMCGASLVTPTIAVTAAHCVDHGYVARRIMPEGDSGRVGVSHLPSLLKRFEYNR